MGWLRVMKVAELLTSSGAQSPLQVPFVTTNVYISRLDSPITAPLHTDRFDSFIMQTEALGGGAVDSAVV